MKNKSNSNNRRNYGVIWKYELAIGFVTDLLCVLGHSDTVDEMRMR